MTDNSNLDGQKLNTAVDELVEDGLCQWKNWLKVTPPLPRKLVHIGRYFIVLMLQLLFLMMCIYRSPRERNLWAQVFAENSALWRCDQFPSKVIVLYHRLCGSRHCCKQGGRTQNWTILMALAWGWWIDTSDSYHNRRYDQFVHFEWCNCWSPRPQPENPRALGLQGRTSWGWWSACPECYPNFG